VGSSHSGEKCNFDTGNGRGTKQLFTQDICFFCLKPAILENEAKSLKIRVLSGKIKHVPLHPLGCL
jgi:hypothetical protein